MADVLSNQDVRKEHFADLGVCSGVKKDTRLLLLLYQWLPHVTLFSQNQHSRIIQSVLTPMKS